MGIGLFYQFIYDTLSPFVALIFCTTGQMADVASTVVGIRYAGLHEQNPLARPMAHSRHPWLYLTLFKVVILGGLHLFYRRVYGQGYSKRDLKWLGLVGWGAAVWNTSQMIKD